MPVIYAQQPLPKSIFLAGPTPRNRETPSWRPEACRILEESLGFTGTILVPETEGFLATDSYDAQISWEWEALNQATVVVFWIPRDLAVLPGFTTNIEFGALASSGKVVASWPANTPKISYIEELCKRYHIPLFESLRETLKEAVFQTNMPFGRN